jgi:hypothetical protein
MLLYPTLCSGSGARLDFASTPDKPGVHLGYPAIARIERYKCQNQSLQKPKFNVTFPGSNVTYLEFLVTFPEFNVTDFEVTAMAISTYRCGTAALGSHFEKMFRIRRYLSWQDQGGAADRLKLKRLLISKQAN